MHINQTNVIDSPNYPYMKMEREEIERLKSISYKCKYPSYGYIFLVLQSKVICENVDTQNKICFSNPSYKANMYIADYELGEYIGTYNRKVIKSILDVLQDIYEAIEYKAVKTYDSDHGSYYIYYIHFKICNQYITKGDYSRNNKDAFSNVMAIKSNSGFFLVNKEDYYNTFFNNRYYSHSLYDTYILLRLNTTFCSDVMGDSVPDDLKHTHIAVWKIDNKTPLEDVKYSLYCRQKDLSEFLGVDSKTIQRYLKILKNACLIEYEYMHKRGTVILFSALDDIEPFENIAYPELASSDDIYCEITEDARIKSIVFSIKQHIQKLNIKLKSFCNSMYSMINRKLRFINFTKIRIVKTT